MAAFAAVLRPTSETTAIDFGASGPERSLREGWGPSEPGPVSSFRWGAGPLSRVSFELVAARDVEVRLRGWSFPFTEGGEQRVEAFINGESVGERTVSPAATAWTFEVPAARVRAGENLLELRYARWNENPDQAPWAVAWDGLRFDAGRGRTAAQKGVEIDVTRDTVALPAGTSVDATLDLPPGTRLVWDSVERSGGARLEVAIEAEVAGSGAPFEPAERSERVSSGGALELTAAGSTHALVRFALRAIGAEGEVIVHGLHLEQPERVPLPDTAAGAAAKASPPAASGSPGVAPRPNLILYVIDTLRADHLGCYGYARPTSPRIDRFAAESILFRHGRAQSSWTKPAVASILTGLYPVAHGAQLRSQRIHESVETLSERLQAQGYETALFTTNANISARFGFGQGWDEFRYLTHRKGRKHGHFDAQEMNREVFAWLEARKRREAAKPFLLVVHTLEPHDPYRPREEFRARLAPGVDVESACCGSSSRLAALTGEAAARRAADAMALYDAEIAQNDAAFGDLLDELDRRGLAEESAVLLTADHGEEFFDHGGWKHGFTLYEEMLRIPLILRLPTGSNTRRAIAVSLPADQVDIAPTFLALAGAPPAPELPGRDLLELLGDGKARESAVHASFAWLERPGAELVAMAAGGWKLVRYAGDPGARGSGDAARLPAFGPRETPARALYDLDLDPGERASRLDLAARHSLRELWLEGKLASGLARYGGHGPAEEAVIDPELEKSLRALGYF
ncbi:MAG: sulfatase [Thermoanaerobaculia bacterium]